MGERRLLVARLAGRFGLSRLTNSPNPELGLALGRNPGRIGELLSVRHPPPLTYARRTSKRRRLAAPGRGGGRARREPQHAAALERLRQADLLPQPGRPSALPARGRRRRCCAPNDGGGPVREVAAPRPTAGDDDDAHASLLTLARVAAEGVGVTECRISLAEGTAQFRILSARSRTGRDAVVRRGGDRRRGSAHGAGGPAHRPPRRDRGPRLDEPARAQRGGDAAPARRRRRPGRAAGGRGPQPGRAGTGRIARAALVQRRQRHLCRVHGAPGGAPADGRLDDALEPPEVGLPEEDGARRDATRTETRGPAGHPRRPHAPRAGRRRLRHPSLRPRRQRAGARRRVRDRRVSSAARPAVPRGRLRRGRRRRWSPASRSRSPT